MKNNKQTRIFSSEKYVRMWIFEVLHTKICIKHCATTQSICVYAQIYIPLHSKVSRYVDACTRV